MAPRLADPVAPMLVPRLVGPEMLRIGLDRGDDVIGRMRREMLDERGDDPLPLPLGLTEGGQDRVVEIEQDRGRKLFHQVSTSGACGTVCQNPGAGPKQIRAPLASRAANRSSEAA